MQYIYAKEKVLRNFIYISITVLFAHFYAISTACIKADAKTVVQSKSSYYYLSSDAVQDLLLCYDDETTIEFDCQNQDYSFLNFELNSIVDNTFKFYYLLTTKLNPLTTDIPPPFMIA